MQSTVWLVVTAGALMRAPIGRRAAPIARHAAPVLAGLEFQRKTAASDGPLLLFLPGIDGTGGAGATQWARLASQYEVHSLSYGADDRSTFDECVEACTDFLQSQQRAALLVGESAGAVLALGVALRSPESVNALCLVNPATSYSDSPLSTIAPLLPNLPRQLYEISPGIISPIFGKGTPARRYNRLSSRARLYPAARAPSPLTAHPRADPLSPRAHSQLV